MRAIGLKYCERGLKISSGSGRVAATVAGVDMANFDERAPRAAFPAPVPGTATAAAAELVPAERVPVSFAGRGAGRGALSWGQREIWSAMMRQGWLCISGVLPLSAGRPMQDVAAEISTMIGHFPSMRTRLRFDDDSGIPSQELFDSGQIMIEVFDTDADAESESDNSERESKPDELAAQVEARYRAAPRDFVDEWPQRIAVIRSHGQLTHMVVVTCHLVTDGAGVEAMNRQIAAGLSTETAAMQQLEQAAWQSSAAGRRQSEASLRYWERMLRSIPPRALPKSADPREPRHWTGRLRSTALYAAVPAVAERTGTDSSSVLLALYAVALNKVVGVNPVVVWPLVNNRFRPGLADPVCNLVQSGICVLDVEDVAFGEVARHTWRTALTAYKHAYYASEQHAALIQRIAPDQGPESGVACFFNDRRLQTGRPAAAAPLTPQALSEAAERSDFSWTMKKDNPFERLFLNVEDGPEAVDLSVAADTHYFAPADIEELVRYMETVAITEATAS